MKFTEEAKEKATAEMCADDFWKKVYEFAPEGAKKRLRVAFWGSRYMRDGEDLDAYRAERERIERKGMTRDDALYLAKHFPEGPGKTHYAELTEKIARRPMMTDAKLDAAIGALVAMLPENDRKLVQQSKDRYDRCDDGFFTKEIFWKAVGGDGDSCSLLGDCFAHGHGVEPDETLAYYWFSRGAMSGDGDCCYQIAHIHEQRDSALFDMKAAVFWMMEGLRRGCADAKREIGYRLAFGEGSWEEYKDPKKGIGLLREAVDDDPHGYALYYLAKCIEFGAGTSIDLDKALEMYKEAKRRGHWGADEAIERVLVKHSAMTVKVNECATEKKHRKTMKVGKMDARNVGKESRK